MSVHFISSEQPRPTLSKLKESAAIKIQKVFRGFIVRKSVKKVASIRNEVSEIEQRTTVFLSLQRTGFIVGEEDREKLERDDDRELILGGFDEDVEL